MINPFGTNSRAKQAHNVVRAALSALHGEAYESFDPDRAGISMVGVFLIAFRRASLPYSIGALQLEAVPAGFAGVCGNKGGVAMRMDMGGASLCVVGCHLPAGKGVQKMADLRKRTMQTVLSTLSEAFDREDNPPPLEHDLCVVFGDLNARLMHVGRDALIKDSRRASNDYVQADELPAAFESLGLKESDAVNFGPTYKFDPGTDNFDTSKKKRPPAWTDRVLWGGKRAGADQLTVAEYTSCPSVLSSDHKPVAARMTWRPANAVPDALPVVRDCSSFSGPPPCSSEPEM
eukprot:Transcript_6056.p1 GENE.Transcript_6056~~Transcript_6056.p1  ORF type:complete len:290 (-),score=54.50 Transcript_6056:24-893(-)